MGEGVGGGRLCLAEEEIVGNLDTTTIEFEGEVEERDEEGLLVWDGNDEVVRSINCSDGIEHAEGEEAFSEDSSVTCGEEGRDGRRSNRGGGEAGLG